MPSHASRRDSQRVANVAASPGGFQVEASGEKFEWYYEDGLQDYLTGALGELATLPEAPFVGNLEGKGEALHKAGFAAPEIAVKGDHKLRLRQPADLGRNPAGLFG